jgi:hypothetical protein
MSHHSGRQPKMCVKPEAAITVLELLMMGGVSPETCRAIKKHWNNKSYYTFASCSFFLWVLYYDARIHERQVSVMVCRLHSWYKPLTADWPMLTVSYLPLQQSLMQCNQQSPTITYQMYSRIHTLANQMKFQLEILTVLKIVIESGSHNLLRELFLCAC